MSRLDELPPDQRAALSLLLRQRKSYGEVAKLLAIQEAAVHDRAHAALALLAPREARELPSERREEVGDYLLGQQAGVAERLATRAYLNASSPARRWANAVAAELAPLNTGAALDIPDGSSPRDADRRQTPVPSSPSREGAASAPVEGSQERSIGERLPSSRTGGALLLAALAAAVVAAVLLITGGGGKSGHPSTAKQSSSAAATNGKTATGPAVTQRITLSSPDASSKTVGAMEVLAEGTRRAFFIDVENLPESKGFFYALWLYNSPQSHEPLSKSPPVGSSHKLQGGSTLPANAASYHKILLTRETNSHPTSPGAVVLSGPFSVGR
jgi:hypothetical protein